MKKLIFSLLLLFGSLLFLGFGEVEARRPTFDLNIKIQRGNNGPSNVNIPDLEYGKEINIDTGTFAEEGYEFLGYIIQGKVTPAIENAQLFRVTEDMDVVINFKPVNSTAVVFMDSNHDLIDVKYTNAQGKITEVPNHSSYSKPGLTTVGWNIADIENHEFTEDTIVYLQYENNSAAKTLVYDTGNGSVTESKEYNSLVTLNANGTGDFSYWLKDGKIASLNPQYTFTMVSDHTVEAIYDDTDFVKDSDTLVYISDKYELRSGHDTIVGQIHLGENEELIEWGIIASNMEGGITFDTPDVKVAKSSRYNETSKEFMMSFDRSNYSFTNYRGYVNVINTVSDEIKTVYSYIQDAEPAYATDLIISEYGEGSSNNKWIEIYNGTGQPVDLSGYSIELYSNGATTPSATQTFTNGTIIVSGETYLLVNSSANATLKDAMNITSSTANFNGDDAIALIKNSVVIDVVGTIGNSMKFGENTTFIRKSTITSPQNSFSLDDWNQVSIDSFTDIGLHTMNLPEGAIIILTNANTPQDLTVTGDSIVNANETIQLASSEEDIVWVSSNPAILTVDQTGLVTGVAEGSATVTAYSLYNHSVNDAKTITVESLQSYDVTFNNEGVTSVVNVEGGSSVIEPANPTKAGYVFEGWFVDLLDENAFDFATSIQSNLTLYAKWVEITSILDFRTNESGKYIEGIVTGLNGRYIFINDGTAAIAHYDTSYAIVNNISVGDRILFGEVTYNLLNELVRFNYSTYQIISNNNSLPSSITLTSLSEINADMQTQRISISGLTVSSYDGDNLFVSDGTNNIMIWSMTGSAVRQLIETAVVGQTINLTNIHIGWYNAYELTATDVAEIELVELPDSMKVNEIKTELTDLYNGKSYASGGTIELISTSVRFGGTINWSTNNEVIDLSDGSIGSLPTDTLVTLTASTNVNGTIDTVTVEVTVLASGTPENIQATLIYGNNKYTNSAYSEITNHNKFVLSDNSHLTTTSITFDKAYWATGDNAMRLGSSKANGSITFDFEPSIVLSEVRIVALEYDTGSSLTVDGETNAMTSTSTEYIYDITNGSSFTVSGNKRVQIVSITIIYSNPN